MFRYGAIIMMWTMFSLMGCCWIGDSAGQANAGVEIAISDTMEGFHIGYSEGKDADIYTVNFIILKMI